MIPLDSRHPITYLQLRVIAPNNSSFFNVLPHTCSNFDGRSNSLANIQLLNVFLDCQILALCKTINIANVALKFQLCATRHRIPSLLIRPPAFIPLSVAQWQCLQELNQCHNGNVTSPLNYDTRGGWSASSCAVMPLLGCFLLGAIKKEEEVCFLCLLYPCPSL